MFGFFFLFRTFLTAIEQCVVVFGDICEFLLFFVVVPSPGL